MDATRDGNLISATVIESSWHAARRGNPERDKCGHLSRSPPPRPRRNNSFSARNRIHCAYNQTKPAAFHHFSGDEQARIEIAFYDFPGLTSWELRPERSSPNAGKCFRRGPLIESPRRTRPPSRLSHPTPTPGPD